MQHLGRVLRWIFSYVIAAPLGFVVWGLVLLVGAGCNAISPGWWVAPNRKPKQFFFETAFGVLVSSMAITFVVVLSLAMLGYVQPSGELAIVAGEPRHFIARFLKPLQLPYLVALTSGVVGMHVIHGTIRTPTSASIALWTLLAFGYLAFLFGLWSVRATIL